MKLFWSGRGANLEGKQVCPHLRRVTARHSEATDQLSLVTFLARVPLREIAILPIHNEGPRPSSLYTKVSTVSAYNVTQESIHVQVVLYALAEPTSYC